MTEILLVGCGNMGQALVHGWLDQGFNSEDIRVVEPNETVQIELSSTGVQCYDLLERLPNNYSPEVIFFAIKPQIMETTIPAYAKFNSTALFISIAAGKTVNFLENHLGTKTAIIRVMPNTPASIRKGISGAFANSNSTEHQKKICHQLMSAVGEFCWLEHEDLINAVTALSGSGPAYVFLFSEYIANAGKLLGLSEELSERLARMTIFGSGALLCHSNESAATLRKKVTSPGGTTEAALDILMKNNTLKILLEDSILQASARSKELAEK